MGHVLMQAAERISVMDHVVHWIATGVEAGGVAMLAVTAVASTVLMLVDWRRAGRFAPAYKAYRRNLGRGILLGLEFLVIADIIGTVAVEPSFHNLGILGVIVIIRTFLSFSLEVEIEGRLPWRKGNDGESDEDDPVAAARRERAPG